MTPTLLEAVSDALAREFVFPGVHMRADGRIVVRDADVERGFATAVRRLGPFVESRARQLSNGDRELAADLAQEAWIKLWEVDPLRFDPENRDDQAYVRAALLSRMRDVARKELGLRAGREIVRMHVRLA
jgi:DNA-directed RNA polymerase specialized sigma24 family protein